MPPQSRPKSLVYKWVSIHGVDEPMDPIDTLLGRALLVRRYASERRKSEADHTCRVLNSTRADRGMVFGNLLDFTAGNHQTVLTVDHAVSEYVLSQMAPPSELQEFLEGVLYFGALDNHIVLAQAKSLRDGHLERYLEWLLKETGVIPESALLKLNNQLTLPAGADEEKLKRVRSVTMRTDVTPPILKEHTGIEGSPKTAIVTAVRELLPPEVTNMLESLETTEGLKLEDLEITFEIRRKGKIPKEQEGRSIVDDIADLVRNADAEDLRFELDIPAVGLMRGSNFKLGKTVYVPHVNGAATFEGIAPRMADWLQELIATNRVPATRSDMQ